MPLRSKSNSKGKFAVISKAEEERLLADVTRPANISGGHNYQTISSSRKNS